MECTAQKMKFSIKDSSVNETKSAVWCSGDSDSDFDMGYNICEVGNDFLCQWFLIMSRTSAVVLHTFINH